jgi:hypothetical protein
VQCRAAVNAHRLAFIAKLAGVAVGASDIQIMLASFGIGMTAKADGQVAWILLRGLLIGGDEKTKTRQIIRRGKFTITERQLKGAEPFIAQAFNLSPLRGLVVGLAFFWRSLI